MKCYGHICLRYDEERSVQLYVYTPTYRKISSMYLSIATIKLPYLPVNLSPQLVSFKPVIIEEQPYVLPLLSFRHVMHQVDRRDTDAVASRRAVRYAFSR